MMKSLLRTALVFGAFFASGVFVRRAFFPGGSASRGLKGKKGEGLKASLGEIADRHAV